MSEKWTQDQIRDDCYSYTLKSETFTFFIWGWEDEWMAKVSTHPDPESPSTMVAHCGPLLSQDAAMLMCDSLLAAMREEC